MSNFKDLFNKIQTKTAFVIGDAILDCSIFGEFTHKSAETNINVFKEDKIEYVVGGAGNVALNLLSANQNVKFCSIYGNDGYGKILKSKLIEKGIDPSLLVVDNERKTTVKKRYFSDGTQVFRSDNEDSFDISSDIENAVIEICKKEIPSSDIVVISDYAKGLITYSLVEKIVKIANESGVKTVVDPKTNDYTKYKNCSYIKPNYKEFTSMKLYGGFDGVDDICAKKILEINNNDGFIVTLGKKGMLAVDKFGKSYTVNAVDCDVVDVCGAGDTALAYVVVGLVNDFDLKNVIVLANKASSLKLSKIGAKAVSLNDVFLPNGKLVDIKDVEVLKKSLEGKKVVFTNGCFDIIHKGHVESLKKASKIGDVLVVGVNSDASVKRLKGENRPINSLEGRVAVLSAFSFVDYVIPFDNDTPYELIKILVPNVLVKGDEYKNCGVIGQDMVVENGGKVVYIEMEQGYSTTAIVDKIYENKN